MKKILFLLMAVCMLGSCKKKESDQTVVQPVVEYQDGLTVDNGKWKVDSTAISVRKFYEGHYMIKVDSAPNMIAFSLAPFDSINYSYSVQVDATVQFSSPGTSGNVGIIFNWVDKQNYGVAELTSKGYYRIWERVDGSVETIQSLTLSSAIHTGNLAENTIKVIQGAESVQLIINGTTVGSFDVWMPDDFVKVGVSTSTGQNPAAGLFNNFILEKI